MSLEMKYFVLKPHGISIFAAASRRAMRAYATMVQETDRDLADSLRDWADREQAAAEIEKERQQPRTRIKEPQT